MGKNLLIIHGGGPTAVINASLYGAVEEAKKHPEVDRILAAKNGTGGMLKHEFIDLTDVPEEKLKLLLQTPGSAIGTSRDAIDEDLYRRMAEIVRDENIGWVLMNGGNGTMDTCGHLCEACEKLGVDAKVIGIPKTMDNDLAVTDHAPGYGSAARFIAHSVEEVAADVRGLAIHVVIVEASGRNAGWITAASALAADKGYGPDLIYLPERDFDEDKFIEDVKKVLEKKSGVLVVVSEGLHGPGGQPIVPPIMKIGRATYFGDVSSHLANVVIHRLGYKARGEKPGLLGRASIALESPVDRDEAVMCGAEAVKAALAGKTDKMVAMRRVSSDPYRVEPFLTDIRDVMMTEHRMPDEYINAEGNGVTEAFLDYVRPLIGGELPDMISFN